MRDNPFPSNSAEGVAASRNLRWAAMRMSRPPWNETGPAGSMERLRDEEKETRVRRQQTGNDAAYRRLLRWFDNWTLDLGRLGPDGEEGLIEGLLDFPGDEAFWNRVFEVWCLKFVAAAMDSLGWRRSEGPVALHRAEGAIYRYVTSNGAELLLSTSNQLQRSRLIGSTGMEGRSGVSPTSLLRTRTSGRFPLVIDAKNRYVASFPASRAEETYKMLGYAENFLTREPLGRFCGVLLFPGSASEDRRIEGPQSGHVDIVTVDLDGNRSRAQVALAGAIADWADTSL